VFIRENPWLNEILCAPSRSLPRAKLEGGKATATGGVRAIML